VEVYEFGNVKDALTQYAASNNTSVPQHETPLKKPNYIEETKEKNTQNKPNLPPNAKNLQEFIQYASLLKRDKVRPYILDKLLIFVRNAKPILEGDMSKVEESFVLDFTEKDIFESITTPEEEWLQYNYNNLRRQVKRQLFNIGYDFLDSDFEVGKIFNPMRHNIAGIEKVDSSYKDNRVLRIVNEGLIIGKRLHINANVIVGKYKGS